MSRVELADFLRRRREALRPDGGPARPRRRTPGLRREEVAERSGVSVSYYERLEQARAPRPSAQVVTALGQALRLTPPEIEHLARLAGLAPDSGPAPVPADARRLLDRLGPLPAYLVDERQDIVAWNRAAVALITDFALLAPEERNVTALSIRFGGTLCAEPAPGGFARALAAELRASSARRRADRRLGELVNAYAAHEPEFAAAWRDHDVRPPPAVRKQLDHPELGPLDLELQILQVPGTGLRLHLYTAEPGSPSATALAALVP
ncbi:helix-turn-helix transcriptional regulator [Pseudonocardia sp. HH130630-07]|uniref:helix-turn-helix transcriptional regulator n=1 Tax=Pseudonocardia sp. HH130630-07 TaxID=1690815 RepID=UPI000815173A|nr:helix-turn-helix transcriptional regulator [Pseudonocardia sp. HH130630-07]ANY08980.1 DNA-binding protein [Pseudonocardia sp. HH130630-07]